VYFSQAEAILSVTICSGGGGDDDVLVSLLISSGVFLSVFWSYKQSVLHR
jgi:hypothetical protein